LKCDINEKIYPVMQYKSTNLIPNSFEELNKKLPKLFLSILPTGYLDKFIGLRETTLGAHSNMVYIY